jgi:hypothetical protein
VYNRSYSLFLPLFIRLTKIAMSAITTSIKTAIMIIPLLQSTREMPIKFISKKGFFLSYKRVI